LGPSALLYASSNNQSEQIFVGGDKGEIHLYEIEQQTKVNLMQTFPTEHPSRCCISSFLQQSENTLISSAYFFDPSLDSANAIAIWTKSKSTSSHESLQRIAQQKSTKEGYVMPLLFISLTNELLSGSYSPDMFQI